jgi:ornithine carbamoyltransferase
MLRGRDFLWEGDFTRAELRHLLNVAARAKVERGGNEVRLQGKHLALVFEKTSTRTRAAFEVAMRDEGGHVSIFDPQGSQIGHKESVADTGRVLSGMFDAIAYRGKSQRVIQELADAASVPVYNALTDEWHPTQMLADFLTMQEHGGGDSPTYAYVGDARSNMGRSLLVMGAIMGSDVRIVAPRSLWPDAEAQAIAAARAEESGARVTVTEDLAAGLDGVDFLHTDVWVSMGEPAEVWDQRIELLRPYRIDATAMALTDGALFMHCLPAYHDTKTAIGQRIADDYGLTDGVEVSNEVFESASSIVFDQAENRLHTIKSVLLETLA